MKIAATENAVRPTRDQRRDAILLAAHEVFLEHGFAAASMSQVAALLGGSKGTLYSYFENKEALFEALVADSCAKKQAAIFDAFDGLAMVERLTEMGCAYLLLTCSDWATRMFQVVATESRRRPVVGELLYDLGPGEGERRLSVHLEEFAAAGLLKIDDGRAAAQTFMVLCRGNFHLRRILGQEPEPTRAFALRQVRRALDQFLTIYAPD